MSFSVHAVGLTKGSRYLFSEKLFADPGEVIKGFELLQKLLSKAKIDAAEMNDNYKRMVNKLGAVVIANLLRGEIDWYSRHSGGIVINHQDWGYGLGILRKPSSASDALVIGQGGTVVTARRFLNMLERLKINRWGYIRALLEPMSGYSTACEQRGVPANGLRLVIDVTER